MRKVVILENESELGQINPHDFDTILLQDGGNAICLKDICEKIEGEEIVFFSELFQACDENILDEVALRG